VIWLVRAGIAGIGAGQSVREDVPLQRVVGVLLNARRWPNRWGISFGKDRKGGVGRGFAIANDIPEADFQDWVAAND
jgi:hypothetical protein